MVTLEMLPKKNILSRKQTPEKLKDIVWNYFPVFSTRYTQITARANFQQLRQ
jgi:hypothetical protein